MNTTKKGDAFELQVFNMLSRELANGDLLYNPKHSKIFHKKQYFSEKRGRSIIFDICIETFLPERTECSIRTIIECKDLSRPVECAEVEEFYSKIKQVTDVDVKGLFVSSNSFQPAALNFAKNSGIALLRILPEGKLKWILSRAFTGPSAIGHQQIVSDSIARALTDESYSHDCINYFGVFDDNLTHSLFRIFSLLLNNVNSPISTGNDIFLYPKPQNRLHVEFIDDRNISLLCRSIIQNKSNSNYETPIYEIAEKLEKAGALRIEYAGSMGRDRLGHEVQGGISFNPTIIFLASHGRINHHRRKFTLAHELGHYFLKHDRYLASELFSSKDERLFLNDNHPDDICRMEWQANRFASHLLLPRDKLREAFSRITHELDIRDRGYGALFVDDQIGNLRNFISVLGHVRRRFNVSDKVIEIALKEMKLINDQRRIHARASVPIARLMSDLSAGFSSYTDY